MLGRDRLVQDRRNLDGLVGLAPVGAAPAGVALAELPKTALMIFPKMLMVCS